MDLKERIKNDLKEALKEKNEIKTSALRMLNAAILNKEKEKRLKVAKDEEIEEEIIKKSQLNQEELIEALSSEAKKRKESISGYREAGREELAEKEEKELKILEKYLPEQLSEEEIEKLAKEIIEKNNVTEIRDVGKVMSGLMPKTKGRADGNLVFKIVKDLLSN